MAEELAELKLPGTVDILNWFQIKIEVQKSQLVPQLSTQFFRRQQSLVGGSDRADEIQAEGSLRSHGGDALSLTQHGGQGGREHLDREPLCLVRLEHPQRRSDWTPQR